MMAMTGVATETTIRMATVDDRAALLAFLATIATTSRYTGGARLNLVHLSDSLDRMLAMPDAGFLVAIDEDRIVGVLVLLLFDDLISGARGAAEVCWYVEPSHRAGLGPRLLGEGERWADEHCAAKIQMLEPDARFAPLYTRRGYTPTQRIWERRFACRG